VTGAKSVSVHVTKKINTTKSLSEAPGHSVSTRSSTDLPELTEWSPDPHHL